MPWICEQRYSDDQPRDDHGRFSGSGSSSKSGSGKSGDIKSELKGFATTAAITVAALALKRFGWKRAPTWLKQIARKSLRSAEDPTNEEIAQVLATLSAEQQQQLVDDLLGELDESEMEALLTALHEGHRTGGLEMERRALQSVDLKVDEGDKSVELRGHAAIFNVLSDDLGGFREKIAPGAFTDAVGDDVRALFNHDPNFVLGRTKAGTLHLEEDANGLAFRCNLPATQTVRDLVVEPIKRGDISQMSFQFAVRSAGDEWTSDKNGMIRTLKSVRLFDISPVTFPAYPQTDVAVRSLRAYQELQRAAEASRTPINLLRAKELLARVM